jgi:hypothetical protein
MSESCRVWSQDLAEEKGGTETTTTWDAWEQYWLGARRHDGCQRRSVRNSLMAVTKSEH